MWRDSAKEMLNKHLEKNFPLFPIDPYLFEEAGINETRTSEQLRLCRMAPRSSPWDHLLGFRLIGAITLQVCRWDSVPSNPHAVFDLGSEEPV